MLLLLKLFIDPAGHRQTILHRILRDTFRQPHILTQAVQTVIQLFFGDLIGLILLLQPVIVGRNALLGLTCQKGLGFTDDMLCSIEINRISIFTKILPILFSA